MASYHRNIFSTAKRVNFGQGSAVCKVLQNQSQSEQTLLRGAFERFSVLRIWPMFGSVFRFSHLKLRFFGFRVFHGLRLFSNLVFGFQFSSIMMAVFGFFVQCILRFFWFSVPRKLHPTVAQKPA